MSGCRHLLDLAASLRAQKSGIGYTLRGREIEAVAQWIESWTPRQTEMQRDHYWQRNGEGTA